MAPQTTARAVKPGWTDTEPWREAQAPPAMTHPPSRADAAGTAAAVRCTYAKGWSPDAR